LYPSCSLQSRSCSFNFFKSAIIKLLPMQFTMFTGISQRGERVINF
jgi:predicted nuclease with RNAse H fold